MAHQSRHLEGALAAEEGKLLACVHCGLCLEACPTYVHTGDENDSPRGRLYLMRAVEEQRLDIDSRSFTNHINRCLGCRACESACPAGVEYGRLLEAARADIRMGGESKGWTSRLLRVVLRHVWLQPVRLRAAMSLARRVRDAGLARLLLRTKLVRIVSPRFEFALALLESSAPVDFETNKASETDKSRGEFDTPSPDEFELPAFEKARDERGVRALLFTGCVMEGLFAPVNRATARVLEANGCATDAPRGQGCCGALHAHAGDLEGARTLARRNIDAFDVESEASIVTNAGGCGAMLISYEHLLEGDGEYAARARAFSARVRDVSQQLEASGTRRGVCAGDATTTYDASCHLVYGQRAGESALKMLGAIGGLRFAPLEGSEVCCGGAGVYNLVEPELSARVLAEKLARIKQAGAQILATGNPGCHMQIGAGARLAGVPLRVCHPVELLDESYRRAGVYRSGKDDGGGMKV